MILNRDNYYSKEADQKYMSVSQFKNWIRCEAMALVKLNGQYNEEPTTALLQGYI
jgi:hypothetical protein